MTLESEPLVSVLMTVYNYENYLSEAINSVLNSTYENWELIIQDDCSTDSSYEIALRYSNKDSRINVFRNNRNLGDYPNRNMAAENASGTYLKFLDADDKIYPHGLEQLVFYMEKFPKAGFGLCSFNQLNDKPFPLLLKPRDIYISHYIKNIPIFHRAPLSSIIKREVFESIGGFKNVRHYGDLELWHRLSKNHSVVLMPQGIIWSRESPMQESNLRRSFPMVQLQTINAALSHISSCSSLLTESEKNKVLAIFERQKTMLIMSTLKGNSFIEAFEIWKKSELNLIKFFGLSYRIFLNRF